MASLRRGFSKVDPREGSPEVAAEAWAFVPARLNAELAAELPAAREAPAPAELPAVPVPDAPPRAREGKKRELAAIPESAPIPENAPSFLKNSRRL